MTWRRPQQLQTLVLLLALAVLATSVAWVVLTERQQREEARLRLLRVARSLEAVLGMHLDSDAALLDALEGLLETDPEASRARRGIEGYLAFQPHLLLVARREGSGQISLLLPAKANVGMAEALAQRAFDASLAGLSRSGFTQIFTGPIGNCIALVRPDRRAGHGANLIAVYSLDLWIEHIREHADLVGARLLARGPLGEILAGPVATGGDPPSETFGAKLDPPGHGLVLEIGLPPRSWGPLWLGLLSAGLGLALVASLTALSRQLRDRRVATAEAAAAAQRFHTLVQNVDAIVWEAEPDASAPDGFRFTFVSDQAGRITGLPASHWLEQPSFWLDHLHPEDRDWASAFCAAEGAAGRSYELEYRLRTATGGFVWVHDAVRVTTAPDGRPVRLSGVLVDVTRARELEQALKAASHEWRATFDALDTALLVVDGSRRIERLNRAAAELLGADWSRCLHREPWEVAPREPWLTAEAVVQDSNSDTLREVRDDDGRVWELATQPIQARQDRAAALILTLRDVTRLKELQESLRYADTWATMGALVAGVAHEVRNPLFAMSVNIDALASVLGGREDVAELIEALVHERDRINRLMEDLLHYGRPAPAPPRLAALEPVLASAVAHCGPVAGARGVGIVRHGSAAGLRVRMDPGRMEEVLVNLLENACQHSLRSSEVRLEVETRDEPRGPRVLVRVRDWGPGIPADVLARMFEPFYTRRKGGTGLGLAIVQRFVTEVNGEVRAENQPGGGTVMTVSLPLTDSLG